MKAFRLFLARAIIVALAPIEVLGCTWLGVCEGALEGWLDGSNNVRDLWRLTK